MNAVSSSFGQVSAHGDVPGNALLRVSAWLSPVFPTGSFAYSAGLEQAVADGDVTDEEGLECWLATLLACGSLRNDAWLMLEAWGAAGDGTRLVELGDYALALATCPERMAETQAMARSFLQAVEPWIGQADLPEACRSRPAFPVVFGACCRLCGIDCSPALPLFLQAFVSNQLQAAIRLSVTGQGGAARILYRLEGAIARAAGDFLAAMPAGARLAPGSFSMRAEIASMRHETLGVRLFRS